MSNKDHIIKYTGDEININDANIVQLDETLIPDLDVNIVALKDPAKELDEDICDLTVQINQKLDAINTVSTVLITCGCGTTTGIGSTPVYQGSYVGYERITITRQDSESPTHSGVNPFSIGIFGSTTDLTSGIGSTTSVNSSDFGNGIKTNVNVLSGTGNTSFRATVNLSGVSTCGTTCTEYNTQLTNLNNEITELRNQRTELINLGLNDIKEELKVQYTRRHGYKFAKAETQKRTTQLKKIKDFSTDPARNKYFKG